MQPIVGVISDASTSKWGRRRPFLLGGSIIVVLSLFVIGWTKEITWLFTQTEQGDTVCIAYQKDINHTYFLLV
jgi:solute carrier family 45 protein 1/2/4